MHALAALGDPFQFIAPEQRFGYEPYDTTRISPRVQWGPPKQIEDLVSVLVPPPQNVPLYMPGASAWKRKTLAKPESSDGTKNIPPRSPTQQHGTSTTMIVSQDPVTKP